MRPYPHAPRLRLRSLAAAALVGGITLLSSAGGSAARAQTLPIAATDRYESFDSNGVSATALTSGGFAVLWSVGDSPYHLDTRLQYLSPQGDLLLGSQGVSVAGSIEIESGAFVAPSPTGGVFAAYLGTLSHTAEVRVYLQDFDAAGRALWPEEGILATQPPGRDVQSEPRLLADGGGGVFVCLTRDDGSSGVSREIVCQHLNANGDRLWGETGRSAGGLPGTREQPSVVSDGRGGLLVFWLNRRDLFAGGPRETLLIEGQRFSAGGQALWGEVGKRIVDTGLPASEVTYDASLRAVADGTGGAVLAYRGWSGRGPRTDDALAQRINRDGRLLWRKASSLLDGPEDQILTALIPTLDGGAIAAIAASAHDNAALRLFRLAGNGRHRWGVAGLLLTEETGSNHQASARGAVEGTSLFLAWVERPGWPASRATEIRTATFDARGRRTDGAPPLEALADGYQDLAGVQLDAARRLSLTLWNKVDYAAQQGQDSVGAVTSLRRR